mgnify:FL=1
MVIELTDQMERLRGGIKHLRGGHDYRLILKTFGKPALRDFFMTLYTKYDITTVEKIVEIPDSTLERWFQKLEIPFERSHITSESIPASADSSTIEYINNTPKKVVAVKITPELAYLIGFTLGDGSVQKYMVEVFNKDRKLKDILFKIMQSYGKITQDERENGLWRLRLSSGKIASLIKKNKRIREDTIKYIFADEKLAVMFIAAFWDAEGSVLRQRSYFHVYLYNSNLNLLKLIGSFLHSKKLDYSILKLNNSRNRVYFLNGRQVKSKKTLYRLGIPKRSVLSWARQFGVNLKHSKKQGMVKEILLSGD